MNFNRRRMLQGLTAGFGQLLLVASCLARLLVRSVSLFDETNYFLSSKSGI